MTVRRSYDRATSDGCSAGVRQLGRGCCVDHDERYHHAASWRAKIGADLLLGWCLIRHGWRECRAHRQPYAAMLGWLPIGIVRGVVVMALGWAPWLRARKRAGALDWSTNKILVVAALACCASITIMVMFGAALIWGLEPVAALVTQLLDRFGVGR